MEIPDQYKCPISLEIMSDPVICTDGITYERECILAWTQKTSPMTREPINKSIIIPNIALKQLIQNFADKNGIILDKQQNKLSYESQKEKICKHYENEFERVKYELSIQYSDSVDEIYHKYNSIPDEHNQYLDKDVCKNEIIRVTKKYTDQLELIRNELRNEMLQKIKEIEV